MSRRDPASVLAEMAALSEPPEIDEARASRMIEDALDLASAPAALPETRGWGRWAAAAAIVLALGGAGAWAALGSEPRSPEAISISQFGLPTGDRLTTSPGARFEIAELGPRRHIRVRGGTLVFDVQPLSEGQSFEVSTPHLRVRVVGTVFGVEVSRDRSTVRVYEGHVHVTLDGRDRSLAQGDVLTSRGEPPHDPLAGVGGEIARARRARPVSQPDSQGQVEETAARPVVVVTGSPRATRSPLPRSRAQEEIVEPLPSPAADTPESAREWIARGQADRALAAAERALAGGGGAVWRLVQGDALRALARPAEAADAYELAIGDSSLAAQAGYLTASVRAERLGDPSGALEALERGGSASPSSPLAERALALRAELLTRLERGEEAAATAREYLERFPQGPRAGRMRTLAP